MSVHALQSSSIKLGADCSKSWEDCIARSVLVEVRGKATGSRKTRGREGPDRADANGKATARARAPGNDATRAGREVATDDTNEIMFSAGPGREIPLAQKSKNVGVEIA